MKYLVRVIMPDGKSRMIVEETVENVFSIDTQNPNNNLDFYDRDGNLIISYHTYNWLSYKPCVDAFVSSQEPI